MLIHAVYCMNEMGGHPCIVAFRAPFDFPPLSKEVIPMLKVILAKIGISLFRYLPLEQIVAKLLTSVIQKLLASKRANKIVDSRPQDRQLTSTS